MRSGSTAAAPRTAPDGFTLIEVVVAVAILATAIVWSLTAHGTELRTLTSARSVNVAIELAEDRMTAIELLARDRLPSLPDSIERGSFPAPFADMTWVAEAESLLDTDLVEVTVTVEWDAGAHSVTKIIDPTPGGAP